MKLVECVPNFSEGRDRAVIDAIAVAIRETEGVTLLDVDPGAKTNRTVFTMVGSPEAVVEGAFNAIARAAELIDMSSHTGAHPRIGATDVCPFVPLSGVTMDECVELAKKLGARVGEELGIPVYLYEYAASRPERVNLADIRAGEYEGLKKKLEDPQWKPDFGPAVFNARSGATVIGAREFLIAYNINLNTRDKDLAHDIALTIRESGRLAKDAQGNQILDAQGNKVKQEGMFQNCKAIGWFIDEYRRAQISINFTNYKKTPVHTVFEAVRKLAAEKGMRVTGSEMVGLTPKEAMLMAGRFYLQQQGKSVGVPERQVLEAAVMSLGLNEVAPFDIDQKIIEYRVDVPGKLASMAIPAFADEVSIDSPVPGGGSVAALSGAMSAALAAMVGNLTHKKKGYEAAWETAESVSVRGQALKDFFIRAIDRDSDSFDAVMAAMRLPKKTDAEKEIRTAAIENAGKGAVNVPMETLRHAVEAIALSKEIAAVGNVNTLSDAGVAAQCGRAAAIGAAYNVLINLPSIKDTAFVAAAREEATRLRAEAENLAADVDRIVLERMG